MAEHLFYAVLAALLYPMSPVCGDLAITSERNVAAAVNGSVSFTCRTSKMHPIRWQHTAPMGIPSIITSDGRTVKDRRLSYRVRVTWDQSIGQSMLALTMLQSEDAGSYECLETGNVKKGFGLTVVDANPMCQLNTSFGGFRAIRPHDYIDIYCHVKYAGSWAPNISCLPNTQRLPASTNTTSQFVSHHFRVSGSSLFTAAGDVDLVRFFCTAGFHGPSPAVARGSSELDAIPPKFEKTWRSAALYVSDEQTTRTAIGSNGSNGQLTIIMTSSIMSVVGVLAICVGIMIVVMMRFMRKKKHEIATKDATEEGNSRGLAEATDGLSHQPEVVELQPVAPRGVVYNGSAHYDEINDDDEPHDVEESVKLPYEGLVGTVRLPPPVRPVYDNIGASQGNRAVRQDVAAQTRSQEITTSVAISTQ